MSNQLYRRNSKLIVANRSGEAFDLSELRITFNVKKTDAQSPNIADIKVYNLSADTARIIEREFTDITFQAGYEGVFGVIFQGNAKEISIGQDPGGVDTFLAIQAADGDAAYNFAVVNTTLAAGSTQADHVAAAAGPMAPLGTALGHLDQLDPQSLPRGKVLYGMSRNHLRRVAESSGTSWSIQDGRLQFIALTGYLPGEAVVLRPDSGLVGRPQQSNEGVKVRCLLNPLLRIGGRVVIEQQYIEREKATIDKKKKEGSADSEQEVKDQQPATIAADGQYRIIGVEYSGDTFGNDWYADLVCLDIDATAPANKSVKKA